MRSLEPNLFLSGLSQESEHLLASHSVAMSLSLQTVLYEANLAPRFAYFLRTGIASVVVSMTDGETAEVGMIGREGAIPVLTDKRIVNQRPQIGVLERSDLVYFMGRAEPIKEMQERNARFESGRLRDEREIGGFLH